ncbi:MAG TPA: 2-C-methyl-D-erythritol 2,4-cyclodiphosphate synthase [Chthoniobacterales bacterium]
MFRCGIGYDVHRLSETRKLVLGGVEIPHGFGLEGHSDADVLSHAVADALLGAAGERDIGHHFPNSDESIRGISSLEILRRVGEILGAKNCRISNIDVTLIAEAPKIGAYLDPMREKISAALGIEKSCVGIKATTNEGLGALGRGEGMAALAVASIELT